MNFNRRNFLRSASLLSALTLSDLDLFAAKQEMKNGGARVAPDDEKYWKNVRQLFPLDKELSYLNNGTMGPSPYPVLEKTQSSMQHIDKTGEYGGYETSVEKIADFIGADKQEIALTHNVTEGINIACWGMPLHKRDQVIMTTHEHVGNAFPWLNRQKLHGIEIKTFTPGATAEETLNRISDQINKKTKAIAIPHIPCTQGQVLPVKEICALAKEKGIYSFIDGAHGPGMMPIDVHDIGCDAYASCGHKWLLGPKGTGFLYVRRDFQSLLQPYFVGGGSDDAEWDMTVWPTEMGDYANTAHRYYGGTQNSALFLGLNAAIDFMNEIGMENVRARVAYLGKYTQDRLLEFDSKVEMLTPVEDESRLAVNGFRIKGVNYKEFFQTCMKDRVRIRAVPENKLNSLRVSTHIYNNTDDVDRLIAHVSKATV